ncbi:transcription/translation regulatory transformer protein RfaH [Chromatiaceae bacterium AAb-1]|nr:transcription/translation regulatory transformer protein RfaH [Chromatiaceae bacterium AAb-1]
MEVWHLLYCKPRQEVRAQQHLANQGLSSFLPLITINKLRAGKRVTVTEPLFPRYLFLHLPQQNINLSTVRSTRGVSDFVRFGSELVKVPAQLIASLTRQQIALQQQYSETPLFRKGEALDITDGPFSGLEAVYNMAEGDKRSCILINLLGQWVKTTMDNRQFEKKGGDIISS